MPKSEQVDLGAKGRRLSIEWSAAIVLGSLAIACFAIQALTVGKETTTRETALYNALQFLLTVGFTWFSTRAVSRNEFEQSLKRFAISAYRRVADIERMVLRLQGEVQARIGELGSAEAQNLRIVEAIISDTGYVVRSSISDWADVIGEELIALEQIRRLKRERQEVRDDSEGQTKGDAPAVAKIDDQIKAWASKLPPKLQIEADQAAEEMSRLERHAAGWVRRMHMRDDGLRLTVVTGSSYDSTREQETLQQDEPLLAIHAKDTGIDVVDAHGRVLGRLQNPSPLTYDAFSSAFEACFGTCPLPLRYSRIIGVANEMPGITGWFEVAVAATPIIDFD